MSVTVSEIDVPSSAVRTTGSTTARASASRSRSSWVRSLRAWAMIRRTCRSRRERSGGRRGVLPAVIALHDQDEHVLEREVLLGHPERPDPARLEPGGEPAGRLGRVTLHDHVDAVAEERHPPGLALVPQERDGARGIVDPDLQHPAALRRLDPARGAFGHQLAAHHEAEAIALLGLLEVVRGHEDRGAT